MRDFVGLQPSQHCAPHRYARWSAIIRVGGRAPHGFACAGLSSMHNDGRHERRPLASATGARARSAVVRLSHAIAMGCAVVMSGYGRQRRHGERVKRIDGVPSHGRCRRGLGRRDAGFRGRGERRRGRRGCRGGDRAKHERRFGRCVRGHRDRYDQPRSGGLRGRGGDVHVRHQQQRDRSAFDLGGDDRIGVLRQPDGPQRGPNGPGMFL